MKPAGGGFLAAGLIDELSTLICPAIDGLAGVPAIFEHSAPPGSHPAGGSICGFSPARRWWAG